MILLQRGLIVLIAIQLIYCCYTDIFERKIRNKVVFTILLLSLLLSFVVQDINIKIPLSIMIVGFFINLLGVIGAGDIKLIASLSFSIPASQFIDFAVFVSLPGVFCALSILLFTRCVLYHNETSVPFGVAITIGYIMTMWRFVY